MTKIKEVLQYLEEIAPLSLQESYDNSGLIVGDSDAELTGILICLDSTEAVVKEAILTGCNLIIAHHPIVFSGLKRFTGSNYVERTIIAAIKNDIAIYAAHTNLDNIANGVNKMIADKLGLINAKILAPKKQLLKKLIVFCPFDHASKVRQALFEAGAGSIGNYDECSFNSDGTGTFRPGTQAKPFSGNEGITSFAEETKIEVIIESHLQNKILAALFKSHPYEEVAYDLIPLENYHQNIGSGMIAELSSEMEEMPFLDHVKKVMKVGSLRFTPLIGQKVAKVALCGGSGSFLLNEAKAAGAQVFITSDFKYHQFFDAEDSLVIADIGHFESEQYTMDLFKSLILKNFSKFAVRLTEVNTNPVNYL